MRVVARRRHVVGWALVAALGCLGSVAGKALDVPTLQARVTDSAQILTTTDRNRLEQKLADYEQRTGHQFAALLIPSLQGGSLEEYSMRVVESWKLGDQRRDDGLLVLIALKERMIRIEVGYGLEGAIPDALTARIRDEYMVPAFRRGDFAGGLEAGLDALMKAAEGEAVGSPSAPSDSGQPEPLVLALVLFFIFATLLRRIPRPVRVALGAMLGALIGYGSFHSAVALLGFAVLGAVLGFIAGFIHLGWPGGGGGGGFGGGFRSGGGFRGGGGGFGGGGSSGKW